MAKEGLVDDVVHIYIYIKSIFNIALSCAHIVLTQRLNELQADARNQRPEIGVRLRGCVKTVDPNGIWSAGTVCVSN